MHPNMVDHIYTLKTKFQIRVSDKKWTEKCIRSKLYILKMFLNCMFLILFSLIYKTSERYLSHFLKHNF